MNAHSDDFGMAGGWRNLSQAYLNAVKHEDDREPPPRLDAVILAVAHRAVSSRPQTMPTRWSLRFARWRVPLAMAASFLIGVLIAILFEPEKTRPETQILAQAPQMTQVPALPELEPSQPSLSAQADEMRTRKFSTPALHKDRARAPEKIAQPKVAQNLTEPAQTTYSNVKAPVAGIAESVSRTQAPAELPAVAQADASAAALPLAMPAAANKPVMSAQEEGTAKQQNPQAWLEEIEKLRRDGKIREARESLAGFRKHYPNHDLPKALRDL